MIYPDDAAFPRTETNYDGSEIVQGGLTKLEYFGIEILKAMIAANWQRPTYQSLVKDALDLADAYVYQLNQRSEK